MGVEIVLKIAAVGLIVAVLNGVLSKAGRDDYALITALAGIVAVIVMLFPYLEKLQSTLRDIMGF